MPFGIIPESRSPYPGFPGLIRFPRSRLSAARFSAHWQSAGGVTGFRIEGYNAPAGEEQRARANWVTPGYLRAVGMPVLEGRDFSLQDSANTHCVAIISSVQSQTRFPRTTGGRERKVCESRRRVASERDVPTLPFRTFTSLACVSC